MRNVVLLAALLAAACGSAPSANRTDAQAKASNRPIDTLCMQDCMGDQAGEEFCKDRCSF